MLCARFAARRFVPQTRDGPLACLGIFVAFIVWTTRARILLDGLRQTLNVRCL
jgi:hypothetical protein